METKAGQNQVLPNRHGIENRDQLEGPHHSPQDPLVWSEVGYVLSKEMNPALGGRKKSGKEIEKGRLSGPIGSDDPNGFIGLNLEIHPVNRNKAPEMFG